MATELGYQVSFLAGGEFRDSIGNTGTRMMVTLPGVSEVAMIARASMPLGVERLQFDMKEFFLDRVKQGHGFLYEALEKLHEEDATWEIVVVTGSFYLTPRLLC
ncbi:hypothetical protein CEP53_009586 [Fusarium sp. AF-6]|nr:hypothetical protein CEP53_009586 [Fusarium sp. AF-6]